MKKILILLFVLATILSQASNPSTKGRFGFMQNKGQVIDQNNQLNPAVKYLFHNNGLNIQLRSNGFSYDTYIRKPILKKEDPNAQGKSPLRGDLEGLDSIFYHRIDIDFIGANTKPQLIAEQPLTEYTNYYTTGTPEEGVLNVKTYQKVTYINLYEGIDLEFSVNTTQGSASSAGNSLPNGEGKGGAKYNFIIHPGADASQIKWTYNGAFQTALQNGNIILKVEQGDLTENIPSSFIEETTQTLKVGYVSLKENTYSFSIPDYDKHTTLIIDPIPWATYFGGPDQDFGSGVSIDASGNIFMIGGTHSQSNIATTGAFLTSSSGEDIFLVKFSSSGIRQWATYYRGYYFSAYNVPNKYGIATDVNGNCYITGNTGSATGIATTGAYQTTSSGNDAFIAKFNTSGVRQWGTYFGGANSETGYAIKCTNNYLYIVGVTKSTSSIATSGAYQTVYAGGGYLGGDAFLAKFSLSGVIQWATYYGGAGEEIGYGVCVDPINGNVYLTGYTNSTSSIATSGAYQTSLQGTQDVFIVKFDSTGARLWGTYYGGNGYENANAIGNESYGNIVITGTTSSTTGIATTGAYQTSFGGVNDSYIAKFTPSGSRVWGTYFGGDSVDYGNTLQIDANDNIIIGGNTQSPSGIATTGAYRTFYSGGKSVINNYQYGDGYISNFTSSGALNWSTYYGDTGYDEVIDIALDANANIFAVGNTNSTTGIATTGSGVYSNTLSQDPYAHSLGLYCGDAFLAAFTSTGGIRVVTNNTLSGSHNICLGSTPPTIIGSTPTAGNGIYAYQWLYSTANGSTGFSPPSGRVDTINYSPTASTQNTWYKRVVISGGIYDTSAPFIVVVSLKPIVGYAINNYSQCMTGNNFVFNDTSSFASSTTRIWNFGVGATDTSTLPSYSKTYSTIGNYSVKLVVTGSNGCADSLTKTIGVGFKPTAGFTINNTSQCINGTGFVLIDTSIVSSGALTRVWSFGEGVSDISTSINPTKYYSGSGTFTIKLLSASYGCKDSITKTVTVNPKPSVGFTTNTTAQCVNGNNFLFNDTSSISSGIITRKWNFGNGSTDTSAAINPTKIYASANTYQIKLVEVSNNGCRDSITKTITVNPKPSVGFTTNTTAQCINGNNFLLNDTSSISSGTITRKWNFGTGNTDTSTSLNPNKTYASANIYQIKLVEVSNNGCRDSITKTVTVNPKPSMGFTTNTITQCVNGNVFLFNDTSTISSGTITRNWDLGNGTNSTIVNPTISYTVANTYQIKLVSTSNNSCKDSITKTVTVNPKPNVGFTQNNTSQCITGNNFILNDTSSISSGAITRLWNFGDATTSTIANNTKSYSTSGTYQIKLVITSNNNCKDSLTKTIMVYNQPKSGFTINNTNQCLTGNSFIFNDTTTTTNTRLWNLGDASTNTSNSFSKNYTNSGTYQVKLKVVDINNCSDSVTKIVAVYTQPKSGFTINNITQCLIGNSFSFDDTTSTTNARLWNLGDATTNTLDTFSKTYSNAGVYIVKLKVIDTNSCSDSITKTITVKPNPAKPIVSAISNSQLQSTAANSYQWFLNNTAITSATNQTLTITQNGTYKVVIDSTNGCGNLSDPFTATKVNVEEVYLYDDEIKLYPNPATDELFITINSTQNIKDIVVEVYDLKGAKQFSTNQNSTIIKLDVSNLSEGMYIVKINNKAYKFVKAN